MMMMMIREEQTCTSPILGTNRVNWYYAKLRRSTSKETGKTLNFTAPGTSASNLQGWRKQCEVNYRKIMCLFSHTVRFQYGRRYTNKVKQTCTFRNHKQHRYVSIAVKTAVELIFTMSDCQCLQKLPESV